METTQGYEANHSGKFLESVIESEFRARKVDVASWNESEGTLSLFYQRRLLTRVPYTSIYGCNSHSEFVYLHQASALQVRIECRWQEGAGSVDEKFPYLLENARDAMPERNVWLVVDGGGARPDAVAWLRKRASQEPSKRIRVYSMIEAKKAIKILVETGEP